jgi:hypothetical protein
MAMPWLKIKVGDADEVDVSDVIKGLDFMGDDENPTIANTYQNDSGRDGGVFQSSIYGQSIVNANFMLTYSNYIDYKLAKAQIFRLFFNKQLMRFRTDSEPAIVKYVRAANFEVAPIVGTVNATFTIPFENPSGYKYSLLRSDALDDVQLDNEWQFGMHLQTDVAPQYHFVNQSNMTVYNPSDIDIDPYYQRHDLKLIIKFAGDKLCLENSTNGSKWQYNVASDGSHTIILDGINTTLDGKPASANTDFGNLVLAKGNNSIAVTGATASDITFSFPFIYLG